MSLEDADKLLDKMEASIGVDDNDAEWAGSVAKVIGSLAGSKDVEKNLRGKLVRDELEYSQKCETDAVVKAMLGK